MDGLKKIGIGKERNEEEKGMKGWYEDRNGDGEK